MPSGPIGSCWAAGSWSDTAWEANTWAGAGNPPDAPGGGGRGGYAGWQAAVICTGWLLWMVLVAGGRS